MPPDLVHVLTLSLMKQPSYDVLEGPGHHTGKPPSKAPPVTQEKYDVLDVKVCVLLHLVLWVSSSVNEPVRIP